jgi:hypothetical protein
MQHPFAGPVLVAGPVVERFQQAVPGTLIFAVGVLEAADLDARELEGVVAGMSKGNSGGGGGGGRPTTLAIIRGEEGGTSGTPIRT